jgi:hypothetical protein
MVEMVESETEPSPGEELLAELLEHQQQPVLARLVLQDLTERSSLTLEKEEAEELEE